MFKILQVVEPEAIQKPLQNDEIKDVIFSMKPFNGLGPVVSYEALIVII